MECADFGVEVIERRTQWMRERVVRGQQGQPVGAEDPQIELAVEEGDLQPVSGGRAAVRAREAVDQAFQSEASEVIRPLGRGGRSPEQGFDPGPQVAVLEAVGQMCKAGDRLAQSHHTWVVEAEARGALAGFDGGVLQAVERLLGQDAPVTDALGLEQFAIDALSKIAQVAQVVDPFVDGEVLGVVDRRFRAEGPLLFEVLFDVRGLLFHVQTGCHAVGGHPAPVAVGRRSRLGDPAQTPQRHAIGAAEIKVVADDGLEEVAPLYRAVKDLGETRFQLVNGQAMTVARHPIGRDEGPRQPLRPPVEEGLQVAGREPVTDGLKQMRGCTGQKAVVETVEGEASPPAPQSGAPQPRQDTVLAGGPATLPQMLSRAECPRRPGARRFHDDDHAPGRVPLRMSRFDQVHRR